MKGTGKKDAKKAGSSVGKSSRKSGLRLDMTLGLVVIALAFVVKVFVFPNTKVKDLFGSPAVKPESIISEATVPAMAVEDDVASPPVNVDNVPKGANAWGKPRPATKDCVDRHNECKQFREQGECARNPGWMIINCPRSCNDINDACRLRDPKLRCDRRALNMTLAPVYRPGDMYRMFESIEKRFGDRYGPIVVHSREPFVVTFENFVSDDEAEALIRTIGRWERSTDSGSMNEFGEAGRVLSQGRTSSNGWCTGECERHPKVRRVLRKIEEVTGVPSQNYESFQVLKYELNQFYRTHHDYGAEDVNLACGPRILTFFLYLSDVEEGGETSFPSLGISVKPKKGRALLWPSTLDTDPEAQDMRTFHEARPVITGTKFAANSWIHLFDYNKPNLWGCTGSFDEL
jgi:prolyl 4-hydroxylase|eukprot:gene15932-11401_t